MPIFSSAPDLTVQFKTINTEGSNCSISVQQSLLRFVVPFSQILTSILSNFSFLPPKDIIATLLPSFRSLNYGFCSKTKFLPQKSASSPIDGATLEFLRYTVWWRVNPKQKALTGTVRFWNTNLGLFFNFGSGHVLRP